MRDSIHAPIQQYLQQQTIVSLVPDSVLRLSPDRFLKAALLPFIRQAGFSYYVMKPRAAIASLPPPDFQICKGTRMHFVDGVGWRDIKEDAQNIEQREMLMETAIREGIEELGLQLVNIVGLFDMGPYNFTSATTGKSKQMWVFAAEVIDANDFLPADKIAGTTFARAWITQKEFAAIGRVDHKPVLEQIDSQLRYRFKI